MAIEEKWIIENPAKGVRFHEEKRENWLSHDQIQRFREALDQYQDLSAANALRLLLLNGSRAGEALKATWAEFDLQRGVWTKPSHHTKQKKTEHVPLSAAAVDLLKSMRPVRAAGPLFQGKVVEGAKKRRARVTLRRPWIQACKAAGLAEAYTIQGKRRKLTRYRPTVRIHDLRHSYAPGLEWSGTPDRRQAHGPLQA